MKKTLLLAVAVMMASALSGCASGQLQYTLSDDLTVKTHYLIAFESSDEDASSYLNEIGAYWAERGMAIYADKDANSITGDKEERFRTKKEAAEAFAAVFAAEDTIFSNVSFYYNPSLAYDTYSLSADISLEDIIRQNEIQNISADQVKNIEEMAKQCAFEIFIAMPGNVTETNADSRDGNMCAWKLEYGKTVSIMIQTRLENTDAMQEYNKLTGIVENNNMLLIVCASAAGFCILTIALSVVLRKAMRKRALKIRVKDFR